MREKTVEQKLVKAVRDEGGICPKLVSPGTDGMPDRMVLMRHSSGNECLVTKSVNGKLREGDVVDVAHLVLGYPLYAKNVTRDGMPLGSFTAGKIGGITSIKIIIGKDVKS